jgi:hypothetical protein
MIKIHLAVLVLTTALALLVWRSGRTPALAFIDYRTIGDRAEFNKFAAMRLVPIPAAALLCLVLSSARPELGLPLMLIELLAVVSSANWISMGVPRFRVAPGSPSAA